MESSDGVNSTGTPTSLTTLALGVDLERTLATLVRRPEFQQLLSTQVAQELTGQQTVTQSAQSPATVTSSTRAACSSGGEIEDNLSDDSNDTVDFTIDGNNADFLSKNQTKDDFVQSYVKFCYGTPITDEEKQLLRNETYRIWSSLDADANVTSTPAEPKPPKKAQKRVQESASVLCSANPLKIKISKKNPVTMPDSSADSEDSSVMVATISTDRQLHRIKNTDENMYASNVKYKSECVLCHRAITSARHYPKKHPDREVYIARISKPMMALCLRGIDQAQPLSDNRYKAFCLFCEKNSSKSVIDWLEHLANHTAETVYECTECFKMFIKSENHVKLACRADSSKWMKNFADAIEESGVFAFACKLCNYIQFEENRIVKHLQEQHSTDESFLRTLSLRIQLVKIDVASSSQPGSGFTKNNNRDMYPSNEALSRACALCMKRPTSLSTHYARQHPGQENYLSRLSPQMMEIAVAGSSLAKKSTADNFEGQCLFCEKIKNMSKVAWLCHLTEHTGEFMHRCVACRLLSARRQANCCEKSEDELILDIRYNAMASLLGFACKLCNFTQFLSDSVRKHIQDNHDDYQSVDEQCETVTFITLDVPRGDLKVTIRPSFGGNSIAEPSRTSVEQQSEHSGYDWKLHRAKLRVELNALDPALLLAAADTKVATASPIDAGQNEAPTQSVVDDTKPIFAADSAKQEPLSNAAQTYANVTPEQMPVALEETPAAPKQTPAAPEQTPAAPKQTPAAPRQTPAAPEQTPAAPKQSPATPLLKIKTEPRNDDQHSTSTNPDAHVEQVDAKLKPWTTSSATKQPKFVQYMLHDASLFALFKCMAIDCLFSAASEERMKQHLEMHEQLVNTSTPSDAKAVDIKPTIDYLECSYCCEYNATGAALIRHIKEVHKSSVFQCQYCFYRSIDAHATVLHLRKYHRSREPVVLVCDGYDALAFRQQMKEMIPKSINDLQHIQCPADQKKFLAIDHFIWHIRHEHKTEEYTCHLCTRPLKAKLEQLTAHFKCHNVGVFECLYCSTSHTNSSMDRMTSHMADRHPDKLMFVMARYYRLDYNWQKISKNDSTILLNLVERIDTSTVRFRQCELMKEALDEAEIVPFMADWADLDQFGRCLDSKKRMPHKVTEMLDEYTLRNSIQNLITLNDFKEKYLHANRDNDYRLAANFGSAVPK